MDVRDKTDLKLKKNNTDKLICPCYFLLLILKTPRITACW